MRLQIARPRPVPPYRRVVDASAWLKAGTAASALRARCRCRCRAPRTATGAARRVSPTRRTLHVHRAALGELDRVADQVGRAPGAGAPDRRAPAGARPDRSCRCRRRPLASAGRSISWITVSEQLAQVEAGGFQFEPVGLELGVVEDVVDDAQQLLRRRVARCARISCWSGASLACSSRSSIGTMPLSGVRISWLIVARNSPLAITADSAACLACSQFLLELGVAVDLALQLRRSVSSPRRAVRGLPPSRSRRRGVTYDTR